MKSLSEWRYRNSFNSHESWFPTFFTESALTWFTSCLTNRTFQDTSNGSLSKPCYLETGVPQGSVLGPLLFSLYTRSLGSHHVDSYYCYADDTQLFLSFPSSSSNTHIATRISECLQTSLLGQLHITSNSKLNSSSSRGQTALTWTCQSPSRTSQYRLHRLRGTWVYSWTTDCPVPSTPQHPQYPVLPHKRRNATPGPSDSHLPRNLLLTGLPAFAATPLQRI